MKLSDLDPLLGTRARLAILATVAIPPPEGPWWTFTALRRETGLADGNLHVQTRKLSEAGYLTPHRIEQGRRRATGFELTEKGRRALKGMVEALRTALEERRSRSPGAAERAGRADREAQTRPRPTQPKPSPPRRRDDFSVW